MPITKHGPSFALPSDARAIGYRAADPDDWGTDLPFEVQAALDILRAASGGITGQSPTVINDVAVWKNVLGTLLGTPTEGNTEFGSGSVKHNLQPRADNMLDLGAAARQFVHAYFSGDITGLRSNLLFAKTGTFSADTYLNMVDGIACSANQGYVIPVAGSMIGLSVRYKVNAHTSDGIVKWTLDASGGDSTSLNSATIVAGDVGNYLQDQGKFARSIGALAFNWAANERITLRFQLNTFVGTIEDPVATFIFVQDT